MLTLHLVKAQDEEPLFRPGDTVRICDRSPIGHYRLPTCLRAKTGSVEAVIEPAAEALGAEMVGKLTYYERCIAAFANILFQKGIIAPTDLARKMDEVEARWSGAIAGEAQGARCRCRALTIGTQIRQQSRCRPGPIDASMEIPTHLSLSVPEVRCQICLMTGTGETHGPVQSE
jgi:hypothetical protein